MKYFLLAALGLLGASGGSWYWQQRQETRLLAALAPLTQTLETANTHARQTAIQALKQLEEGVAKNRNQPRALAVFATATRLHAQANQLLDTLQAQRVALRRTTVGLGAAAAQRLQQQTATYARALRQLPPPSALGRPAVRWGEVPAAATLADLAHVEHQILTSETQAIQRLSRTVGARSITYRLVAVATAAVAPGATYRAHLTLLKILIPQSLRMYCNGQPVPVGPDGVGLVRFRAPRQPGPASWVGMVRINQNGRDTTFVVRVPYRVARR